MHFYVDCPRCDIELVDSSREWLELDGDYLYTFAHHPESDTDCDGCIVIRMDDFSKFAVQSDWDPQYI